MMDIYEKGGHKLEDQIDYWLLNRKENALLFYAKQKGYKTLGLQPVPPLLVSKEKASIAIEMHLLLCSLQDSEYGTLPWTITDTSREMYESKPEKTFKKRGVHVRVLYDDMQSQQVEYVCWLEVYFWDCDNAKWGCGSSGVDAHGVFWTLKGQKKYYENFDKDANKYGKTGCWTVNFKNETFRFSTSASPVGKPVSAAANDSTDGRAPDEPGCPQEAEAPVCAKRQADGATHCGEAPRLGEQQGEHRPPEKRRRASSASEGERGQHGKQRVWGRRQDCAPSSGSVHTEPTCTPVQLLQQQQQQQQRQQHKKQQLHEQQQQQQDRDEQEEDEAGVVGDPGVHLSGGNTTQPASTPLPVAVLSGNANQLKCYRYRLNKRHRDLILYISTTWYWTSNSGQHKTAKITVMFKSTACRDMFKKKVVLPKGVTITHGAMAF